MQKDKKINILNLSSIICIIVTVSLSVFIYSCEKREPASQPDPSEVMKKITGNIPKKLSEKEVVDLYSDDKDNPVDLSKIEKYSIIKSNENSTVEIGIFKLYDDTNVNYVKNMAQTRISKIQGSETASKKTNRLKILNDAEIRSYGNYVYYVSHPQKDKIFKIIEDSLRGAA